MEDSIDGVAEISLQAKIFPPGGMDGSLTALFQSLKQGLKYPVGFMKRIFKKYDLGAEISGKIV